MFVFVSLAGYIRKCTKACMKSHKTAYVTSKNRLRLGFRSKPRWGSLRRSSKAPSRLEEGKPPPQTSPSSSSTLFGSRFIVLRRLKSNVPLPKQFSGSALDSLRLFASSRRLRCDHSLLHVLGSAPQHLTRAFSQHERVGFNYGCCSVVFQIRPKPKPDL